MLTVSIDEIPDGGLDWTEKMGAQWLTPLVGPRFKPNGEPILLAVSLRTADGNVVMQGDLKGRLDFVCSRCAEDGAFDLTHTFVHVFVSRSQHSGLPSDFSGSQGAEFTFFESRQIELEPVAAEELVLALPQFPLCSEDCKGLCAHCGRNLNSGPCDCRMDVVDPRWQKLKEIKL